DARGGWHRRQAPGRRTRRSQAGGRGPHREAAGSRRARRARRGLRRAAFHRPHRERRSRVARYGRSRTGALARRGERIPGRLRAARSLAAYAPGIEDLDLRGDTRLDVDVLVPAAAGGSSTRANHAPRPRARINAVLDGVTLRAVAGLPPIDALHGTLGFAGGHLQPSQLSGQWLGGPVALSVAERRDPGGTARTIAGRGLAETRQALLAAGASDDAMLEGHAEWTALLTLLPGSEGSGLRWRVRADSNLIGVASPLPEPFAKDEGVPLPLRV